MYRGEIWWAELPNSVGSETGNRRPVLIIHEELEDVLEPYYRIGMDFIETEIIYAYLRKLEDALYLLDQTLKEFRLG